MTEIKYSKTYVAAFLYRFGFLLFIPFIQSFLFAGEDVLKLFTLYSADLLVAVLLTVVAIIRCNSASVKLTGSDINLKRGAVLKICDRYSGSTLGSLSLTQGIFMRLFKSQKVQLMTGKAYSTLYLKDIYTPLLANHLDFCGNKCNSYASGLFRTLLMSAAFSNSLTGLLAAAPLIRRASAIIGARQAAQLLEGLKLEGLLAFTHLSPVLARASSILILLWTLGFFTEFFREYKLRLLLYPDYIKVEKGLITRSQIYFRRQTVTAVIFRQSLLLSLWGLYSTQACINVKPRNRVHILSAASRTRCDELASELFGKSTDAAVLLTPPPSALWGYTWLPLLALTVSSLAVILISTYQPQSIANVFLPLSIPLCFVWFMFRVFALFRSSLSIGKDICEVRYFSGMNFTKAVFRPKNMVTYEIKQSVFQKHKNLCNLHLIIKLGKAVTVKIKHINLAKAMNMLNEIY